MFSKFKKDIKKKWQLINLSKFTLTYIIFAVIQAIALILLQLKIIGRNVYLFVHDIMPYMGKKDSITEECSIENVFFPLTLIFAENLIFLFFHIFQVSFCFNAIFHQNMIQLIIIVILEFGAGVFGILQLNDVKSSIGSITSACSRLTVNTQFEANEIPHILIIFIFAVLFAALLYPLYKKYDWSIYKRVSPTDLDLQKSYRTRLIFILCLRLMALFTFLYLILSLGAVLPLIKNSPNLSKVLFTLNLLILLLMFMFEALALYGVTEESKTAMTFFMIFWFFVFVDCLYLLLANGSMGKGQTFWLWFTIIFFLLSLVTFVFAVMAFRNFGEGLKAAAKQLKYEYDATFQKMYATDLQRRV
ncbi:hypothetical protein Glove_26g91 [Diversispora epigaea]|uniref:Uncharacterized protein n=1 Tax=Diversispora epigaea TaxID=1348612 RepID=A0A397JSZ6_9GLOM|nr:hypothetical protein Glove_26g91 [Diversispora epigaea]